MQEFDTLIVGQGIAGSLAAFELYKRNKSFIVFDAGHISSASRIAAGMFTPVSGKRKTVHKNVLQQIALAISVYRQIEALVDKPFLHVENIYQLFDSEAEKDLLLAKAAAADSTIFFIREPPSINGLNDNSGAITITHSGWVDCPLFIHTFRQWLHKNQVLVESVFDYAALVVNAGFFQYQDMQFRNIIFCEGYRAAANPFFSETIIPCKGDIISIAANGVSTKSIIKKKAFYMLPADDGVMRVGATFKWHNNDEALQGADRLELEEAAASMLLDGTVKTISHQSAIRATTPGQQVIAKVHPTIKNMFMFNGLGTKGILNGPWHAKQLSQLIFKTE